MSRSTNPPPGRSFGRPARSPCAWALSVGRRGEHPLTAPMRCAPAVDDEPAHGWIVIFGRGICVRRMRISAAAGEPGPHRIRNMLRLARGPNSSGHRAVDSEARCTGSNPDELRCGNRQAVRKAAGPHPPRKNIPQSGSLPAIAAAGGASGVLSAEIRFGRTRRLGRASVARQSYVSPARVVAVRLTPRWRLLSFYPNRKHQDKWHRADTTTADGANALVQSPPRL